MTVEDGGPSTPSSHPVEEPTLWRLPFEGLRVWRIAAGQSLQLEFDEDRPGPGSPRAMKVEIHGPVAIGLENQATIIDPQAADRSELGPAYNLYRATVSEAFAYKDGRLEMRFVTGRDDFPVDGWILRAEPDGGRYEAWEVRGPGHHLIVGGPDADLTIWDGEPSGTVNQLARQGFFDQATFHGVFRTDSKAD